MPGTHHDGYAPEKFDPSLFGRLVTNPNHYSTLAIDIETFSSVNLIKSGVYAYVESPDFEILIFAYKLNLDPIKVVDLACGEKIPLEIMHLLTKSMCRKIAYNAAFERTCLAEFLQLEMPPEQWHCTMAQGLLAGYPAGLDAISKALKLEGKDKEGPRLIRKFSIPQKPTKANGFQTRIYPEFAQEDWEKYKHYCMKDVEAEEAVRKAIPNYMGEKEHKVWCVDQMVNDRGVLVDRRFVEACVAQKNEYHSGLFDKSQSLTGLANPGSVQQLGGWIEDRLGVDVDSLAKDKTGDLIKLAKEMGDDEVVDALEIRAESSLSSLKKYDTMLTMICNDERVRGLFQYAGASRTHRWAGRGVQLQNLRKNSMKGLFEARQTVREGNLEITELLYGDVADVLSQLIRTSFVAPPGQHLLVADYSAIEARIIAWLAGEQWRLDVFAGHGMIYEASAAAMFGVSLESIAYIGADGEKVKGPNYHLRAKGKVAELACGYQGGVGALIRMGALEGGMKEEELPAIIDAWRKASPRIKSLWAQVEAAAKKCVETGRMQSLRCLVFRIEGTALTITLPSGRKLCYQEPMLRPNSFGGQSLHYFGNDGGHWTRIPTYGGKLVENIIQSIARDCLAEAMLRLTIARYKIVAHVHDEVIIESNDAYGGTLGGVLTVMCEPMPWAPDLLLKADGYETPIYFKKD